MQSDLKPSRGAAGWTLFLGVAALSLITAIHSQGITSDAKSMAVGGRCLLTVTGGIALIGMCIGLAQWALYGFRTNATNLIVAAGILLNAAAIVLVVVLVM